MILASPMSIGSSRVLFASIGSPNPEVMWLILGLEYSMFGMFFSVTQIGIMEIPEIDSVAAGLQTTTIIDNHPHATCHIPHRRIHERVDSSGIWKVR